MDYKNSSQRFRPLGPSVLVVQFSDSLTLRTESSLKDRFKEHRRLVMFPKLTVNLNLNPLLFLNTLSLTLTILTLTSS